MSEKKYLLAKGRAGMGNRILSLLGSILYAQITERKLIVDWSDGTYSNDRSNIFQKLFVISHIGQDIDDVLEIPKTNSVFPPIWIGNLDKSFEDLISEYNIQNTSLNTSTPIIGSRFSVNLARTNYQEDLLVRWSFFSDIHKLRRSFRGKFAHLNSLTDKIILKNLINTHLMLREDIQKRVDTFKEKYFQSNIIIGVHVRYTDRKNSFGKFHKFINKIIQTHPQAQIFLATDKRLVEKEFKDIYGDNIVILTEKWFPPERSEYERLHENPSCPDKLENGIQALVDMYLLASCNYLICNQTSTFSIVAELISNIPATNIIDTSDYSFQRNLRRLISLAERCL